MWSVVVCAEQKRTKNSTESFIEFTVCLFVFNPLMFRHHFYAQSICSATHLIPTRSSFTQSERERATAHLTNDNINSTLKIVFTFQRWPWPLLFDRLHRNPVSIAIDQRASQHHHHHRRRHVGQHFPLLHATTTRCLMCNCTQSTWYLLSQNAFIAFIHSVGSAIQLSIRI